MPSEEKPQSNALEVSVSEISGKLKRVVEDTFGHVRVRGEITGYRGPHSSGHMYFALKDERARIEAVVWRGVAGKLKHRPEEGLEVIASGKLTTYPGSSKYQIVIDNIEPAGAGALMALLEERKKKLGAEGLFGEERKQLLPYMPKVIGVITSPTGAVIRDVLHRISDRFPLHVLVWPARVQGETCGAEVSQAVRGFNALEHGGSIARPDLIIVARGGGSIEDLWGFNDEALVRAVADSEIPVISAVGHETDWTLVDLAADMRAPTPTGAAEMAVPVKNDLQAHVESLNARLSSGISRSIDNARNGLKAAGRGMPTPDTLFAMPRRQLDEYASRLANGLTSATQKKQIRFQAVQGRLNPNLLMPVVAKRNQELGFLSRRLNQAVTSNKEKASIRVVQAGRLLQSYKYSNILDRGFAIVRSQNGEVITSASKVVMGDAHAVQFADASISMVAGEGIANPSVKTAKPKNANKAASKTDAQKTDKQGDLF
ncbi:MAG: exodeoxyribonuclease VII large subunit [Nitratireductor sp.]